MKKSILILIVTLSLISCTSSNENENTNIIPNELLGTWKFVGYYDDNGNEPNGSNYHPIENGGYTTFKNDNTLLSGINSDITTIGTFSVSNDMIITFNYNATSINPSSTYDEKILVLTDSVLEYRTTIDAPLFDIYRYEKVNPNTNISGK